MTDDELAAEEVAAEEELKEGRWKAPLHHPLPPPDLEPTDKDDGAPAPAIAPQEPPEPMLIDVGTPPASSICGGGPMAHDLFIDVNPTANPRPVGPTGIVDGRCEHAAQAQLLWHGTRTGR